MSTRNAAEARDFPHVPAYAACDTPKSVVRPDLIQEMAANDAAAAPQRHEIYHLVHKGLRAAMSDALVRLGRVDNADATSIATALSAVEDLMGLCRDHLDHENAFLHTAMERAVPGSSSRCADDHVHHVKAIADLGERLREARVATPPARERAIKVLYRLLATFVAENFAHMEIEESTNTELLQQHYSDAELLAIEHQIHAHIKPERMMTWLRWILPHVSRQQRAVMMRGMQAGMPAELFAGILEMVKPHLSDAERVALAADLA
jgi:hemerythrin-like domain-containing protein